MADSVKFGDLVLKGVPVKGIPIWLPALGTMFIVIGTTAGPPILTLIGVILFGLGIAYAIALTKTA